MTAPRDRPPVILLLDLDGVLLRPGGYHAALREAVRRLSTGLGFADATLSQEAIDLFEAAGVTSEWDSTAICACLLLDRCWEGGLDFRLPPRAPTGPQAEHGLPLPDFRGFAERMLHAGEHDRSPVARAERMLLSERDSRTPEQAQHLREVLRRARSVEGSATLPLVQELVLGSTVFSEVYGLEPVLGCEGYLSRLDRPTLDQERTRALRRWLTRAGNHASLLTNRPSRAPAGDHRAPEAEIGAEAAGFAGIGIAGLGILAWISGQRGLKPEAFLKPSPVHALTALRCALGDEPEAAASVSAELALDHHVDSGWLALAGGAVCVFDDSAKGLTSARLAADVLDQAGVPLHLSLNGIADSQVKREPLEAAGGRVYPDFAAALDGIPELELETGPS